MAYTVDLDATHEPLPNNTAAADQHQWLTKVVDNLEVLSGWLDWSPTLKGETADPVLGTGGSVTGWYMKPGQWFRGGLTIVAGSGGTAATGNHYVVLPASISWTWPAHTIVGGGYIADVAATNEPVPVEVAIRDSTSIRFYSSEVNTTAEPPDLLISDADTEAHLWIFGRVDHTD